MTNPILAVEGLTLRGHRNGGSQCILDSISLQVREGEIAGLVGESGSGKSMLGSAIGGLQPMNCKITEGRILWRDRDLRGADEALLSALRGSQIAYIFQEPMTALNPTLSIGRQLVDVIRRHTEPDSSSARHRAHRLTRRRFQCLAVPAQRRHAPAGANRNGFLLHTGVDRS